MNKPHNLRKLNNLEIEDKNSFSRLEFYCVMRLMENENIDNISKELKLSLNTVRFYLINAGKKILTMTR